MLAINEAYNLNNIISNFEEDYLSPFLDEELSEDDKTDNCILNSFYDLICNNQKRLKEIESSFNVESSVYNVLIMRWIQQINKIQNCSFFKQGTNSSNFSQ